MHNLGFHPFNGRISRHFTDAFLSPNDTYLRYHDVHLTKEDFDCIEDDWLTDNVISFWEEYLERQELVKYPQADIVLLRPSMSFLLLQTPDPRSLENTLPNFNRTTHIFLPINDCRSPNIPGGGSHWSLLLVSLIDGFAIHYDSSRPSNQNYAWHASQKLAMLVGRPIRFLDLEDTPQQENGSDCGIFVCMFMKTLLLKKLLVNRANSQINMSMGDKHINASKGRRRLLTLIEDLRSLSRS